MKNPLKKSTPAPAIAADAAAVADLTGEPVASAYELAAMFGGLFQAIALARTYALQTGVEPRPAMGDKIPVSAWCAAMHWPESFILDCLAMRDECWNQVQAATFIQHGPTTSRGALILAQRGDLGRPTITFNRGEAVYSKNALVALKASGNAPGVNLPPRPNAPGAVALQGREVKGPSFVDKPARAVG